MSKESRKGRRVKMMNGDRLFYHQYLKSEKWRAFRKEALEFYGHKCSRCQATEKLQVHHKHYRNIGNELLKDVSILCEDCHKRHHTKRLWKNGANSKYMRNPQYDTTPNTYFPNARKNSH